jgi:hypothetical protein
MGASLFFRSVVVAFCVLLGPFLTLGNVSGVRASIARGTRTGADQLDSAAVICRDLDEPALDPSGTLVVDATDAVPASQPPAVAVLGATRPCAPGLHASLMPPDRTAPLMARSAHPTAGRAPPTL